jgi:D-glycero-D-manno-heptose 1,7-bisphosphate phosphatase
MTNRSFNPPPAPLPGAGRPVRGLFVSRAGILLSPEPGSRPDQATSAALSAAALRMLFRAGQQGWTLYLIGNEDSVARGRTSDAAWERFEADLMRRLRGEGIPIRRHYACVDHPRGKGKHQRDSVFRFPNTGALYHAAQEDGIELRESWVVSGDTDELAAGWRAGCRTARVGAKETRKNELQIEPDLAASDLAGTLAEVLGSDEFSRA